MAVRLVLDEGKTAGQVAAGARPDRIGLAELGGPTPGLIVRRGERGLTTEEREELRRLRKENRVLRTERGDPKKRGGLLREGTRVRFAFIQTKKVFFPGAGPLSSPPGVSEWVLCLVSAAGVGPCP